MKNTEYTLKELKQFMDVMAPMYDLLRLVDPTECKVVELEDTIVYQEPCYGVWGAEHRCKNCSSYKACISGHRREKEELYNEALYHIQSNPITLRLENEDRITLVLEFITARKATLEELHTMDDRGNEEIEEFSRSHDGLTSLLNWDGFSQKGRQLIQDYPDRKWLIIAANIKHFKNLNHMFGRQKGNALLMEIANALRPLEEHKDYLFGRLMADQFAAIVPKEKFDEAEFEADVKKLQSLLSENVYNLQIHAGIYEITDTELPFSVMYDRAVMALIRARERGQLVSAWFDQDLKEQLLYKQRVVSSFEETVNAHEYQIFLQPRVDAVGNAIGVEALARWIRPDGTVIPPDLFVPILEDAGLIAQLDQEIWEQAAELLAMWKDTEFEDFYISVNISAQDFYHIDVYRTMTELAERYDLDRRKFHLEISELAVMNDLNQDYHKIDDLRAAGFVLEIDDFGKGYTSLNLLQNIPMDALKMDVGFLTAMSESRRTQTVLKHIVELTKDLQKQLIVEGVDSKEQLDLLVESGCETFQGVFFEDAISIEKFQEKYQN